MTPRCEKYDGNVLKTLRPRSVFLQLIQTSGGLQKLLAFAAESTIPDVQQHAVSTARTAACILYIGLRSLCARCALYCVRCGRSFLAFLDSVRCVRCVLFARVAYFIAFVALRRFVYSLRWFARARCLPCAYVAYFSAFVALVLFMRFVRCAHSLRAFVAFFACTLRTSLRSLLAFCLTAALVVRARCVFFAHVAQFIPFVALVLCIHCGSCARSLRAFFVCTLCVFVALLRSFCVFFLCAVAPQCLTRVFLFSFRLKRSL